MKDLTGCTLGHYSISSRLGPARAGSVYRARDNRLDRDVALEVIAEESFVDLAQRQQFEREARVAARLVHPGILTVYELGLDDGFLYIARELLEGRPLRALLDKGPISPARALRYATELAEALSTAHARGITHGNLTLESLFLTADDRIKVLDFGLAQVGGAGDSNGPAADVNAAGVVLYEMLVGRHPFCGVRDSEAAAALRRESPVRLPLGHGPFARVIERCLASDADARFASSEALAGALRDVASARQSRKRGLGQAAAVVVTLATVGGLLFAGPRACSPAVQAPPTRSVMVLPFQDLSAVPTPAYFVEGMTEALITRLARISALRVFAKASSMRAGASGRDLPSLARELEVDAFVQGTVERREDRTTLRVRLLDPLEERTLWSEVYSREMSFVLALHGELAHDIANEVGVALTDHEERALGKDRAVDPRAYDEYLRGRIHDERWDREGWLRATSHYKAAIELAPDLALAHAALSMNYCWGDTLGGLAPEETQQLALAHAERAATLAPDLAEAQVALGNARYLAWDWAGTERALRRGVELGPGLSQSHASLAELMRLFRRYDEARDEASSAVRLDPLSPRTRIFLIWVHYVAGDYDEAHRQTDELLVLEPDYPVAVHSRVLILLAEGRVEEALEVAAGEHPVWPYSELLEATALARLGRAAEARRILERLEARHHSHGDVPPTPIGTVHFRLGDTDEAFEWWEKACRSRDQMLVALLSEPAVDPLRVDPRLHRLLECTGLTPWYPAEPGSEVSGAGARAEASYVY